ncbi:acyl-CoA dehydrogenase family protein [Brevibacterium daeguense]|uniref:Acyl-CoA dehydrogenase family protein n=1 Tax=Brevibacterium daeguense TaxID=909936 RepID=A0ABP8EEV5_9MICO|nr:acyl-CoA dehydrogenase family protein [Brevibacterium daeguense]
MSTGDTALAAPAEQAQTTSTAPPADARTAHAGPPTSPAPDGEELAAIFRPVFDRIAAGAIDRETSRTLPFEQVGWLREARFGALRVPREFGGYGATWRQFLALLIDLAAADPNIAHLFRGHIAVVEEKLVAPKSETRSLWLRRFGTGDIVGNASTEPGNTPLLSKQTLLTRNGDGWVLNGTKHYSTGSIFADWIDASASAESGEQVNALVSTRQAGVTMSDDWDGFGQKLTGTGTTVFTDALVEPHAVQDRTDRLTCIGAVYQIVLLAAVAGIARTQAEEAAEVVRNRKRVYSHGNADLVRDDPQILQVVGEVTSAAAAARSLVLGTAPLFEVAFGERRRANACLLPDAEASAESASAVKAPGGAALDATYAVELAVYQAQVVIADIVPRAATHLFDALSSSAVRIGTALDRHWRNARTILSHNPVIYRARSVGDYAVNGRTPALVAAVGVAPTTSEKGTDS